MPATKPADTETGVAPSAAKHIRSNKASELENVGSLQRFLRDRYAPALLSPPISAIVVLAFIALGVLSALAAPNITLGLPTEDVLPDDSFIREALKIEEETFGGQIVGAQIVLRGVDFESEATRDAHRRLRRGLIELDFVKYVPPDWLSRYEFWRAAKGVELKDGPFMDRLHDFLAEIGNTAFQHDVVCDRDNSCKHPSETRFAIVQQLTTGGQIEQISLRTRAEEVLRREGFDTGIVFSEAYLLAESDVQIWNLTWTNMVYAVAVIFGIMLVFNPFPIAIWITFCVALIDLDLLGAIWAAGIKLNAVTYVNLVRALCTTC